MTAQKRPDIESLISERARYESWLQQLAAKADRVSSAVVERVRADYESRLAAVVDSLRERADDLRAQAESLEQEIARLDANLASKRDARAEDELRAMVGEYDDDTWSSKRGAHDAAIAQEEEQRADRAADLDRVRGLLADATRPSKAMAAVTDEEIGEEPTQVDQPEAAQSAPAEDNVVVIEPESIELAREEPAVDPELELDQKIAAAFDESPPAAAASAAPASEPSAPAPARSSDTARTSRASHEVSASDAAAALSSEPSPPPAARRSTPFDELAFLKNVVGRPTPLGTTVVPPIPVADPRTAAPSAPVAEPRPSATTNARASTQTQRASIPTFDPPPIPDPAPRATAAARQIDDPVRRQAEPGFDTDSRPSSAGEAARTLKCQECGWSNFPTEWYCEKCGGELAAF